MNTFTRRGFTLVELLTVVVIITILASLSLVALTGSMQTAKEIKTYGTIQKLDAALLPIFESYEQRFADITDELDTSGTYTNNTSSLDAQQTLQLKLHLIHDVMRMEMPSHWPEIASVPSSGSLTKNGAIMCTINSLNYRIKDPPVFSLYFNAAQNARTRNPNCTLDQGAAELLFLIIANLNPEALEGFGGTEIADTDGNGLMEFVDAWGRSIYFLRSAPGFTGSDRQPDIVSMAGLTLGLNGYDNPTLWNPTPEGNWSSGGSLVEAYQQAIAHWPDPFDENNVIGRSWFLYPVIVSAGPDGIFDLSFGRMSGSDLATPSSPADVNPFNFPTGIPIDRVIDADPGKLNHYDNIHNHRQRGGF